MLKRNVDLEFEDDADEDGPSLTQALDGSNPFFGDGGGSGLEEVPPVPLGGGGPGIVLINSSGTGSTNPNAADTSTNTNTTKVRKPRVRLDYKIPDVRQKLIDAVNELVREYPKECKHLNARCKEMSVKYGVPINTIRDNYLKETLGENQQPKRKKKKVELPPPPPVSLSMMQASNPMQLHMQLHGVSMLPMQQPLQMHNATFFHPSDTKFVQIMVNGGLIEHPVLPPYTMHHQHIQMMIAPPTLPSNYSNQQQPQLLQPSDDTEFIEL